MRQLHKGSLTVQISQAKKEELALLITGLRAIHVSDQVELQKKLLAQLERELSTRFGLVVKEPV